MRQQLSNIENNQRVATQDAEMAAQVAKQQQANALEQQRMDAAEAIREQARALYRQQNGWGSW